MATQYERIEPKQREFIDSPNVLGSMLRFYDRNKLHIDHTRRNSHITCLSLPSHLRD